MKILILFLLILLSLQNNHTLWDKLLKKYVTVGNFEDMDLNVVDYSSFRKDKDFQDYINILENWNMNNLTFYEKQALFINGYNAYAIKIVVDYPCKVKFGKYCFPIQSIRDISTLTESVWKMKFAKIGGETYSLDDIEKDNLLNITHNKPGIHYSIVCASASCPNLRNEAYLAEKLDQQLKDQEDLFLQDGKKGYLLDKVKNIVYLSKLFQWYDSDFKSSPNDTTIDYLIQKVKDKDYLVENYKLIKINFMNYSWKLNDKINLNKI